jgi:hypothetical protein
MMAIWKNTELGLQAIIETKGLVIRSEFVPVATIRKFASTVEETDKRCCSERAHAASCKRSMTQKVN